MGGLQGSLCDVSNLHSALMALPLPCPTPSPERQPKRAAMGSRCAKVATGQGHESSMKRLMACVSQDNFSLSSEGEEEEGELLVQGKLLLLEPERQEEGAEGDLVAQQSPEPKQTHS